jgi:ATP-dependent Clp protease ATP-binding subunit ClpA
MFERYTERARRVIFFARHETSQLGGSAIESGHVLLGLIREDKSLTNRFRSSALESIRSEIEERSTGQQKFPTSTDLPLSDECQRILAYANEEADRLKHRHIGTEHLLLGILREEKRFERSLLLTALPSRARKRISYRSLQWATACSIAKHCSRLLKGMALLPQRNIFYRLWRATTSVATKTRLTLNCSSSSSPSLMR